MMTRLNVVGSVAGADREIAVTELSSQFVNIVNSSLDLFLAALAPPREWLWLALAHHGHAVVGSSPPNLLIQHYANILQQRSRNSCISPTLAPPVVHALASK